MMEIDEGRIVIYSLGGKFKFAHETLVELSGIIPLELRERCLRKSERVIANLKIKEDVKIFKPPNVEL